MWLASDVDVVQQWFAYQRTLCGDCGTAEADWGKLWTDIPRWEADTMRCPGCEELAAEQRAVPEKARDRGVKVILRPWRPVEDETDPGPIEPPPPVADRPPSKVPKAVGLFEDVK